MAKLFVMSPNFTGEIDSESLPAELRTELEAYIRELRALQDSYVQIWGDFDEQERRVTLDTEDNLPERTLPLPARVWEYVTQKGSTA